jgi:hypothetical protein
LKTKKVVYLYFNFYTLQMKKKITLLLIVIISNVSEIRAQGLTEFLDDCTWYTDKFITPSTDAAVYISGANWMYTAKKRKLYSVVFSAHANLFFVPTDGREFQIKKSDFKFFNIKDSGGNLVNEAIVPTAYGGVGNYKLTGSLLGQPLNLDTPSGINRESVPYPYIQASVGLWKGFELTAKYTPNITYKELQYQVYGVGLKHNLSQYFKKIEAKNIYFSALFALSKEQVTTRYINATTPFGTLGLNTITGKVQTYQMQTSASKAWKNFELIASTINTSSKFEYVLTGERGTIEDIYPVQATLNDKLRSIYATKFNSIFEISGRYKINNFYLQSSVTIGKFINTGLSLQYEFNTK